MDAEEHVAQRVGRRGEAARFLDGADAGPRAAVARDDVAQALMELPHAGDLSEHHFDHVVYCPHMAAQRKSF